MNEFYRQLYAAKLLADQDAARMSAQAAEPDKEERATWERGMKAWMAWRLAQLPPGRPSLETLNAILDEWAAEEAQRERARLRAWVVGAAILLVALLVCAVLVTGGVR